MGVVLGPDMPLTTISPFTNFNLAIPPGAQLPPNPFSPTGPASGPTPEEIGRQIAASGGFGTVNGVSYGTPPPAQQGVINTTPPPNLGFTPTFVNPTTMPTFSPDRPGEITGSRPADFSAPGSTPFVDENTAARIAALLGGKVVKNNDGLNRTQPTQFLIDMGGGRTFDAALLARSFSTDPNAMARFVAEMGSSPGASVAAAGTPGAYPAPGTAPTPQGVQAGVKAATSAPKAPATPTTEGIPPTTSPSSTGAGGGQNEFLSTLASLFGQQGLGGQQAQSQQSMNPIQMLLLYTLMGKLLPPDQQPKV